MAGLEAGKAELGVCPLLEGWGERKSWGREGQHGGRYGRMGDLKCLQD